MALSAWCVCIVQPRQQSGADIPLTQAIPSVLKYDAVLFPAQMPFLTTKQNVKELQSVRAVNVETELRKLAFKNDDWWCKLARCWEGGEWVMGGGVDTEQTQKTTKRLYLYNTTLQIVLRLARSVCLSVCL